MSVQSYLCDPGDKVKNSQSDDPDILPRYIEFELNHGQIKTKSDISYNLDISIEHLGYKLKSGLLRRGISLNQKLWGEFRLSINLELHDLYIWQDKPKKTTDALHEKQVFLDPLSEWSKEKISDIDFEQDYDLVVSNQDKDKNRLQMKLNHYLNGLPVACLYWYKLMYNKELVGLAMVGIPQNRYVMEEGYEVHLTQKTLDGNEAISKSSKTQRYSQLYRFWTATRTPKNTETYFLSKIRKHLARQGYERIITHASEKESHDGSIYRADNWIYDGCYNNGSDDRKGRRNRDTSLKHRFYHDLAEHICPVNSCGYETNDRCSLDQHIGDSHNEK